MMVPFSNDGYFGVMLRIGKPLITRLQVSANMVNGEYNARFGLAW